MERKVKLFQIDTNREFLILPNAIIDILMKELPPADFKVLLFIYRKTKGWHKNSDAISYSQIMEATGLCRKSVYSSIKYLLGESGHDALLIATEQPGAPTTYKLNPDFELIIEDTDANTTPDQCKYYTTTGVNITPTKDSLNTIKNNTHISASAEKIFENPETLDDGGFDEYVNGNPEMNAYIKVFEQEMGKRIMPYSKVLELSNKFKLAGLTPEEYRQAIREQKANGYTITRMESTENYALNFKKPKRKMKRYKDANPNLSNFGSYWNMQSREEKIAALKDMKVKGRLVPADEAEAIEVGLLEEE